MKKFLIFTIIFFLFSSNVFANVFPDVNSNHKNYIAIEYLYEKEIIHGHKDGTFKPENLITRAEALKIITLSMNLNTDKDFEVAFSDVHPDVWYFPFIMSAKEKGIVEGFQDGNFKPNQNVNFAETLKMLLEAADVELKTNLTTNIFTDVGPDKWFSPYFLYARNNNLILANLDGSISPEKALNRGEVTEIIYRMMTVKEQDGEPFPIERTWDTYTSSKLPFKIQYDSSNWDIIENTNELIIWHKDKIFSQFSPTRIYPNTGIIKITIDKNQSAMNRSQYFENIKTVFENAIYTEFNFAGYNALEVLYPEERIVDWYVYVDQNNVVAIYTEFGNGVLGFQVQQFIKTMLSTLQFTDFSTIPDLDTTALKSQILEHVLVENKGMEMLNLLPQKSIIETDTIGAGTGPIDYYYTETLNMTIKYERSMDVILATKNGRTSAF